MDIKDLKKSKSFMENVWDKKAILDILKIDNQLHSRLEHFLIK